MATFTGQLISATYDAILKTIDNDAIGGTAKQLTDGLGNVTPLYVSTTQLGIGITPTEVLHVSGNIKASATVLATTFSGDLNGTINTATTGTTQGVGDDSTKIATTAFVQALHASTGSGTGGKIPLWSGSGVSTTLTDSAITQESTQLVFSRDIRISDTYPSFTLEDNDSAGSSAKGDIVWLDNAAAQKAIISLNNQDLGITSKGGALTFGTNSTPAASIDVSQNASFFGNLTLSGGITQNATNVTNTFKSSVLISQPTTTGQPSSLAIGSNAINDVYIGFQTDGNSMSMGIDRSDGNAFKISDAVGLGTNDRFKIDTSGNSTFTGSLTGTSATFTGQVTIPETPIANTDAASKGYVDTQIVANNELSEVLANGNTTGGTDIAITAGDKITNFTSTGIDDNATSTALTIDSSENSTFAGDVGIETGINLESGVLVIKNATSDSNGLRLFQDSSDASKIYNNYNGTLQLGVNNTTSLTLSSSQNATFAGDVTIDDSVGRLTLDSISGANRIMSTTTGFAAYETLQFRAENYEFQIAATTKFSIDGSGNSTFAGGTIIKSNGVVYLGYTDSSAIGGNRLEVNGNIYGSGNATFAGTVSITNESSDGLIIERTGTTTGKYRFGIGGTNLLTIRDVAQSSTRMAIDSLGRVGIGTTSPVKKLQVSDSATGLMTNLLLTNTHDTNGDTAGIAFSMTDNDLYNKAGIVFERTGNSGVGSLHLCNNNTVNSSNFTLADAALTIIPDRNVGIGTDSPQSKLHIQTDAAPTDIYLTDGTLGTDNYGGVVRGFSVAGQGGRLQLGTLDNDIYYPALTILQQGGNVGIGTDSPEQKLHVEGASITVNRGNDDSSIAFQNSTSGATWRIGRDYSNSEALTFAYLATDYPSLTGNGLISIDTSGNVGIKDIPSYSLDVNIASSRARFKAATGDANIELSCIAGSDWLIRSMQNGDFAIYDEDATSNRLIINSSGNVTIKAPSASGGGVLNLENTTTATGSADYVGKIQFVGNDSGGSGTRASIEADIKGYNGETDLVFGTAPSSGVNTERMRLTNDGSLKVPSVHSQSTGIGANVVVLSDGELLRSTSSLKYKTDVRDYDKGLNEVMQLQPKYYKGINDGDTQFAGLIAEDVHDLGLTEFVQYADDESPDALSYSHMIALLTKSIQELKAEVDKLKQECKCK